MTNLISNQHIPVLLNESIKVLDIKPNGVYVDVTAGMGGHSSLILKNLSSKGKLICIDQDDFAIEQLNKVFAKDLNRVNIVKSNFSNINKVLEELNIKYVDGIFADLGVSSPMFDVTERGFSYKADSKLDMRMDRTQPLSAFEVVNNYSLERLTQIFKQYGEAKDAKKVAQAIVNYRIIQNIETTSQLVDIIKDSVSKSELHKTKHPARTYFQAIRIEVNNELENLKKFINDSLNHLNTNGVLAIISYHSLEDRIVKNLFNKKINSNLPIEIPIMDEPKDYEIITKHPIIATEQELNSNHRSRSAKLRAIKYIKGRKE